MTNPSKPKLYNNIRDAFTDLKKLVQRDLGIIRVNLGTANFNTNQVLNTVSTTFIKEIEDANIRDKLMIIRAETSNLCQTVAHFIETVKAITLESLIEGGSIYFRYHQDGQLEIMPVESIANLMTTSTEAFERSADIMEQIADITTELLNDTKAEKEPSTESEKEE